MIKFILIIAIIVCSSLIGVVIKNHFLNRLNVFKEFKELCKILSTEISFLKTDKYTLLKKQQFKLKGSADFINDYILLGKGNLNILNTSENRLINDFLNSIGKKDVDGELHNLKFYENLISKECVVAEEKYNKYGLFAIKISIVFGTLIAILLI